MAADNRHDLRSGLAEQNRDRNHRAKWQPRWAAHGNPSPVTRVNDGLSQRQNRPWADKTPWNNYSHLEKRGMIPRKRSGRVHHASDLSDPALDPDDDFELDNRRMDADLNWQRKTIYQSDVHHMSDTGTGETLLQDALSNAEVKFEDKQTTKLVKDEYDMVDPRDEEQHHSAGHMVDDEFELL